jgi:hypothetical protein
MMADTESEHCPVVTTALVPDAEVLTVPLESAGSPEAIAVVPSTASNENAGGAEERTSSHSRHTRSDVVVAAFHDAGHAAQIAGSFLVSKSIEAAHVVSTSARPAFANAGTFLAAKSREALSAMENAASRIRRPSTSTAAEEAAPVDTACIPADGASAEQPAIVIVEEDSDDDKPAVQAALTAAMSDKRETPVGKVFQQASDATRAGLAVVGAKTAGAAKAVSDAVGPAVSHAAKAIHDGTITASAAIATKAREAAGVVAPAVQSAAKSVADGTSHAARSVADGTSAAAKAVVEGSSNIARQVNAAVVSASVGAKASSAAKAAVEAVSE